MEELINIICWLLFTPIIIIGFLLLVVISTPLVVIMLTYYCVIDRKETKKQYEQLTQQIN